MLNCIYQGERINSINIMEEESYEYRKQIKKAGCSKELICEDCGHPVILKAGQVKQAHFAHWRGFQELCPYQQYSSKETEAHKKCKALIYHLLKQEYPHEQIQVEYAAIPARRSDIYMEFHTGEKLAIDIHRGSISTANWDNKHKDYQNAGITDLWLILGQPYERKERNMPFFHQIMLNENLNSTAVFINPVTELVILMKNMVFMDVISGKEQSKIFKREYTLNDISILPSGRIQCDFEQLYGKARKEFMGMFWEHDGESSQPLPDASVASADAVWGQMSFFATSVNVGEDVVWQKHNIRKKQEASNHDGRAQYEYNKMQSSDASGNINNEPCEAGRAKIEKYIKLHLELIISGTNERSHIEKLAKKIVCENCQEFLVNIRDSMLAVNNKRGYEACVAVLNRVKKLRQQ